MVVFFIVSGVIGLKQAFWHFALEVLGLLKLCFVSYDKFKYACEMGHDISDHKALKFLIKKREVQARFWKYLTKLLGYDFEILYQLGLQNKVAYVLSKISHLFELAVLTGTSINCWCGNYSKKSEERWWAIENSEIIRKEPRRKTELPMGEPTTIIHKEVTAF